VLARPCSTTWTTSQAYFISLFRINICL
jgi:hypothetical protein